MKKILLLSLALLAVGLQSNAQRKISIFVNHIEDIAAQRGISFSDAAKAVKELGYNGVDVWVSLDDQRQAILDSLGFGHASAIADINFCQGRKPDECRRALDFVHRHGYTHVMLIPGLFPENADPSLVDSVCTRISDFVALANKEGVDVLVEDFDNPRSPCYNTAALSRLFSAVPNLCHAYDTGNYLFAGEDVMPPLRKFRNRIRHVHLKDRKMKHNGESPALGTGIMPLNDVVAELLKTGYDGWFTVEHFGAKDMMGYATTSIANVNAAWDEFERK